MAYKEVSRVDIVEVTRRWQKGISLRHIASGTGLSRDTVRKYVAAAKDEGVRGCLKRRKLAGGHEGEERGGWRNLGA